VIWTDTRSLEVESGMGIKIGEVARRTGLTVRTLRHYEEIGLLPPPARNEGGQRQYGVDEIERLQRIVALRQLDLGLEEIRTLLQRPETTAQGVLEMHLERVEERIAAWTRLRERLRSLTLALQAGESMSVDQLLETLEMMTMVEKHYTPEQLEWLALRRGEVGEERIKQVEAEWPRLIDEVVAAIDAGVSPNDPRAKALAERWMGLVREFSGGNLEIEGAVQRVWEQEGEHIVQQHGMNPRMMECAEFVNKALASSSAE
jgi:DNA-binding transcriptional MerR regulator